MDALGDYERGEVFLTPAEEAAEAEAKEWFDDCAQHVAVEAVRSIIRAARADGFDVDYFFDAVADAMTAKDVWDQASAAEATQKERHQSYSDAVNKMLGFK